jgi:hypothetical protein
MNERSIWSMAFCFLLFGKIRPNIGSNERRKF